MATLSEIIEEVDEICDNSFSDDQKTRWINRLEARIWTDILLISESDYDTLDYSADADKELVADSTHEDIYYYWLQAQIHLAQRDISDYNIMVNLYNSAWENYASFVAFTYEPANFNNAESSLYYISPAGTLKYEPSDGYTINYNTSSDTAYLVAEIPSDSIIRGIVCDIKEAFNSSEGDTIIVGTGTDDDFFMGAGDIDETTIGVYEKSCWVDSGALGEKVYAKLMKTGIAATSGNALIYVLYMQK